jgi:hypothetical protein
MDARADEKKLRAAAEGPELARYARNARSSLPGCFFRQSCERRGAAFVNRLGHLRHLAAQDVAEPGAERAKKPIELTLLPTTSSPAEYCFRAKQ